VSDIEPPLFKCSFPQARVADAAASAGAAILMCERAPLGVATIMARRHKEAALAARLEALYGVALPSGPRASLGGNLDLIAISPGVFLALKQDADLTWALAFAQSLQGVASVSDQSSAYAVLSLQGAAVRDLLQRGLPFDLDARAFPSESAAVSFIGHIDVVVWVSGEVFTVAVPRSMAASFWQWLGEVAAAARVP
jgi:sarcosine oxidase subunit gamma